MNAAHTELGIAAKAAPTGTEDTPSPVGAGSPAIPVWTNCHNTGADHLDHRHAVTGTPAIPAWTNRNDTAADQLDHRHPVTGSPAITTKQRRAHRILIAAKAAPTCLDIRNRRIPCAT